MDSEFKRELYFRIQNDVENRLCTQYDLRKLKKQASYLVRFKKTVKTDIRIEYDS